MNGQVHKAYKVMLKLLHPKFVSKDQQIPIKILQRAKGVAFITVVKAGFIWSGSCGSGIVIAKLEDGTWSGPSSLGVVGMGWGGLIGASVTDSVIILNTDLAVKAFAGHGQIKFGGNVSVSAGPLGREADGSAYAGDGGVAACYSYSHSRGLFAGISLQGAVLVTRDSDNARFYGMPCKSRDILKGLVKPPENEDLRNLVSLLSMVHENGTAPASASSLPSTTPTFSNTSSRFAGMSLDDDEGEDYAEQIQLEAMGWTKIVDPTGKPYYWHSEQNKTQWESPLEQANKLPPPPPVAAMPPAAAQLPPGWVSVPAGGDTVYYWNQERNITQWEMPIAAPAMAARPAPRPAPLQPQSSMTKSYVPIASAAAASSFGQVTPQQAAQVARVVQNNTTAQQQQQLAQAAVTAATTTRPAPTAVATAKPKPVIPPRPSSTRVQNPFDM